MKKLQWRVPLAYNRAFARQQGLKQNHFVSLLVVLACVGFGVAMALYHGHPLANSWSLSLALSAGIGCLAVYVIPYIVSFGSVTITFSDRSIELRGINGLVIFHQKLPWRALSGARLAAVELAGEQFRLLFLEVAGKELPGLALTDAVSVEGIREAFAEHGIELREAPGMPLGGL